jgi:peroxiredoxin Q/BCP
MANPVLSVGSTAPDFTLTADDGNAVTLSSLRGKRVVVYFYPADDTPGCTIEACDFRDNLGSLQGAVVLGVSPDSVESHVKFKQKYGLNFALLADVDRKLCEAWGVFREKNMYGKKSMGVVRSTILIDEKGIIRRIWDGVKVEGHVAAVQAELSSL